MGGRAQGCRGHRCPAGELQVPTSKKLNLRGGEGLFSHLRQYFTPLCWQEGARSPPSAALFPGSRDSMLLLFELLGRMGIISNEAHV